jgi:signal transduction histidine kinase
VDDASRPAPELRPAAAAARGPRALVGWRRQGLVAVAVLACLLLLLWARQAAQQPHLAIGLTATPDGQLLLGPSPWPELQPLQGQRLLAVGVPGAAPVAVDEALLHRNPRWQINDAERTHTLTQQAALAQALASGTIALHTSAGPPTVVQPRPRGLAGLGLLAWPLATLALVLVLLGGVIALGRPGLRSVLYAVVCACQALGLLLTAASSGKGLGLPMALLAIDLPLRLVLDLLSLAALGQSFLVLEPASRRRQAITSGLWAGAGLGTLGVASGVLVPAWPWSQALFVTLALLALAAVQGPRPTPPDPRRAVWRRLALTSLATWLLASAAVALTASQPDVAHAVAMGASVAWYLFMASLLLLAPFIARSRQLLRETALLAGISTVAASLDLLFVAFFSLNATASLAVVVFSALAVYAFARQRILDRLLGRRLLATERIFELLYRAARDVQLRPERHDQRLAELLRELFEPLAIKRAATVPREARVDAGGSELLVPVRGERDGREGSRPGLALRLQLAERGRRLFLPEDARLADRVVEQLRRAVAYDRAVERGRHEERQRLAQDLHDDIGARLLTLMYQAPTPELEDYIRHTLQDLKTLTRGLAVAEHRLGHAAAEWKADLTQRLAAARATLGWDCRVDDSAVLTVVQWSALTRVLRELVTNALFHGHASRVEVLIVVEGARLQLRVADDGEGRNPAAWAHGLGLGGVRKRVKQMGGQVEWREQQPRGIVCEVRVERFLEAG